MLVCYDFHSWIFIEEEDLMFAIEPRLFSIETIVVPTPVMLEQPVSFVSLTSLNLVEHVYDALVEPISILLV